MNEEVLPTGRSRDGGSSRSMLLDKYRAISTLEKPIRTRDEAGEGTIRRRVVAYPRDTQVYRH